MKKVPLRRCVVTKEQLPKKELIRIVKNKDVDVFIDPIGRMNGRGAYLKMSQEAIELAKKTGALSRSLEVEIPESIYEELLSYVVK